MSEHWPRKKYVNYELKPVIDRQLRTPEELAVVVEKLGTAAVRVNSLIEGLVFDERLRDSRAGDHALPSGLRIYATHPSYTTRPNGVTLRPSRGYSPYVIHMQYYKFGYQRAQPQEYMDTRFIGWHGDGFGQFAFWLPLHDKVTAATPDTFTGLDDDQLDAFLRLLDRFDDALDIYHV